MRQAVPEVLLDGMMALHNETLPVRRCVVEASHSGVRHLITREVATDEETSLLRQVVVTIPAPILTMEVGMDEV
jgi:hypothetical protein